MIFLKNNYRFWSQSICSVKNRVNEFALKYFCLNNDIWTCHVNICLPLLIFLSFYCVWGKGGEIKEMKICMFVMVEIQKRKLIKMLLVSHLLFHLIFCIFLLIFLSFPNFFLFIFNQTLPFYFTFHIFFTILFHLDSSYFVLYLSNKVFISFFLSRCGLTFNIHETLFLLF